MLNESSPAESGYFQFAGDILARFGRSLLIGEGFVNLSEELESFRKGLSTETQSGALKLAGEEFSRILEQFKEKLRQMDEERAEDLRKVLGILNEAFTLFGSLSDRSDVRLRTLENSLQQASKLEDIRTLKTHLAEVLSYVKKEAAEERTSAPAQVESLGSQIRQVQKLSRNFKVGLPTREVALAELKSLTRDSASEGYRYAALFVADSLNPMRARHGNELADGLLEQLGRRDLRTLVPESKAFCWSENSVLILWKSANERQNIRDLGKKISSPYEYRALVGNRIATFTVRLRSAVMHLQSDFSDTVRELDQFEGGAARC